MHDYHIDDIMTQEMIINTYATMKGYDVIIVIISFCEMTFLINLIFHLFK